MNYGKITGDKQIMTMPNPFKLQISNPNETQKSLIAQLDNWLPMKYTEQPPYEPTTQYLVETWEQELVDGVQMAVQHWVIKQIEPESN